MQCYDFGQINTPTYSYCHNQDIECFTQLLFGGESCPFIVTFPHHPAPFGLISVDLCFSSLILSYVVSKSHGITHSMVILNFPEFFSSRTYIHLVFENFHFSYKMPSHFTCTHMHYIYINSIFTIVALSSCLLNSVIVNPGSGSGNYFMSVTGHISCSYAYFVIFAIFWTILSTRTAETDI